MFSFRKHDVTVLDNQWERSLSTNQEVANKVKMLKSTSFVCVCVLNKYLCCTHNGGSCQNLHLSLLHYSLLERGCWKFPRGDDRK